MRELHIWNWPHCNMSITRKLNGKIVSARSLEQTQISEMYRLMTAHYNNVLRDNFEKDLSEKRDVILLNEVLTGQIKGFSTLTILEQKIEGRDITALFSGDTIIDKEYWGENELPKWWGRYAFSLIDEMPNKELYWFLMSKGYKTYRFLPVFFNEFYPRYDMDFPLKEKRVLDSLAFSKFPHNYDTEKGIISFEGKKDHLKDGIADIEEARLRNKHINYFVQRNPGWKQGDELACLAPLRKSNFNSMAIRVINSQ